MGPNFGIRVLILNFIFGVSFYVRKKKKKKKKGEKKKALGPMFFTGICLI